jgi:hypothetical protein
VTNEEESEQHQDERANARTTHGEVGQLLRPLDGGVVMASLRRPPPAVARRPGIHGATCFTTLVAIASVLMAACLVSGAPSVSTFLGTSVKLAAWSCPSVLYSGDQLTVDPYVSPALAAANSTLVVMVTFEYNLPVSPLAGNTTFNWYGAQADNTREACMLRLLSPDHCSPMLLFLVDSSSR